MKRGRQGDFPFATLKRASNYNYCHLFYSAAIVSAFPPSPTKQDGLPGFTTSVDISALRDNYSLSARDFEQQQKKQGTDRDGRI